MHWAKLRAHGPLMLALAGCAGGKDAKTAALPAFNSVDLFRGLDAISQVERGRRTAAFGRMSFAQYYAFVHARTSDDAFILDHHTIINLRTQIEAARPGLLALGHEYASLNAYWRDNGLSPATLQEADLVADLQDIARDLAHAAPPQPSETAPAPASPLSLGIDPGGCPYDLGMVDALRQTMRDLGARNAQLMNQGFEIARAAAELRADAGPDANGPFDFPLRPSQLPGAQTAATQAADEQVDTRRTGNASAEPQPSTTATGDAAAAQTGGAQTAAIGASGTRPGPPQPRVPRRTRTPGLRSCGNGRDCYRCRPDQSRN